MPTLYGFRLFRFVSIPDNKNNMETTSVQSRYKDILFLIGK